MGDFGDSLEVTGNESTCPGVSDSSGFGEERWGNEKRDMMGWLMELMSSNGQAIILI